MKRNFYALTVSIPLFLLCLVSLDGFSGTLQSQPTSWITNPANNTTQASAPTLKVTANVASGATRYTIELNTASDFTGTSFVKTSTSDNQRTLIFTGLAYATTYYGRVKTNTSDVYGRVTKFTTRAEEFVPVIKPTNATAAVSPVVVKIVSGTLPDAKRYTIQVSNRSDFNGAITLNSRADGENEFLVKDLKYGTTYYVRSRSDVSTGFGPVTTFTTREMIQPKRLWGLTSAGGAEGFGTVFSFSIDSGTFTKHLDYIETNDYPVAYLRGSLTPAPNDGFFGNSECTKAGTCGNGEIFHLSSQGVYEMKYSAGIHAGAVMLASNAHLYAIDDWWNLFRGGIMKFRVDEDNALTLKNFVTPFTSKSMGRNPHTTLLEGNDGYLYGLAPSGGNYDQGVLFRIGLDGKGYQVLYHFSAAVSGSAPQGSLIAGADGYLYGTASLGGAAQNGTIFKILPNGTGLRVLHHFTGADGGKPMGTLMLGDGNQLYGMTSEGGTGSQGVVFKVRTDGTAYAKLKDFQGADGSTPFGGLVCYQRNLYGMTSSGGANGLGVIFKMATDGAGFALLYNFSLESGGAPDGSLVLAEDLFRPVSKSTVAKLNVEINVGVYPNPFVSEFTARVTEAGTSSVKLMISDPQGNVLQEIDAESNSDVSLGAGLKRGVYLLKVIRGNEFSVHRLVKQ